MSDQKARGGKVLSIILNIAGALMAIGGIAACVFILQQGSKPTMFSEGKLEPVEVVAAMAVLFYHLTVACIVFGVASAMTRSVGLCRVFKSVLTWWGALTIAVGATGLFFAFVQGERIGAIVNAGRDAARIFGLVFCVYNAVFGLICLGLGRIASRVTTGAAPDAAEGAAKAQASKPAVRFRITGNMVKWAGIGVAAVVVLSTAYLGITMVLMTPKTCEIKAGQSKYGVALTRDAKDTTRLWVEYHGKKLFPATTWDCLKLIPSPYGRYMYLLVWNDPNGTRYAFILDWKSKEIIYKSGNTVDGNLGEPIFWSKNGLYAVIPDRYHLHRDVKIVYLVRKESLVIPIWQKLAPGMCYLAYFDQQSFAWSAPGKMSFNLTVKYNTCWDNCGLRQPDVEGHFEATLNLDPGNVHFKRTAPLTEKEANAETFCD